MNFNLLKAITLKVIQCMTFALLKNKLCIYKNGGNISKINKPTEIDFTMRIDNHPIIGFECIRT